MNLFLVWLCVCGIVGRLVEPEEPGRPFEVAYFWLPYGIDGSQPGWHRTARFPS